MLAAWLWRALLQVGGRVSSDVGLRLAAIGSIDPSGERLCTLNTLGALFSGPIDSQ